MFTINILTFTILSWHPQQTARPDLAYSTLKSLLTFFFEAVFFLPDTGSGVPMRDSKLNKDKEINTLICQK